MRQARAASRALESVDHFTTGPREGSEVDAVSKWRYQPARSMRRRPADCSPQSPRPNMNFEGLQVASELGLFKTGVDDRRSGTSADTAFSASRRLCACVVAPARPSYRLFVPRAVNRKGCPGGQGCRLFQRGFCQSAVINISSYNWRCMPS
jgi:hypothetical protein